MNILSKKFIALLLNNNINIPSDNRYYGEIKDIEFKKNLNDVYTSINYVLINDKKIKSFIITDINKLNFTIIECDNNFYLIENYAIEIGILNKLFYIFSIKEDCIEKIKYKCSIFNLEKTL